jgi:hypothetical protein
MFSLGTNLGSRSKKRTVTCHTSLPWAAATFPGIKVGCYLFSEPNGDFNQTHGVIDCHQLHRIHSSYNAFVIPIYYLGRYFWYRHTRNTEKKEALITVFTLLSSLDSWATTTTLKITSFSLNYVVCLVCRLNGEKTVVYSYTAELPRKGVSLEMI